MEVKAIVTLADGDSVLCPASTRTELLGVNEAPHRLVIDVEAPLGKFGDEPAKLQRFDEPRLSLCEASRGKSFATPHVANQIF
jgi:hypothetical protein